MMQSVSGAVRATMVSRCIRRPPVRCHHGRVPAGTVDSVRPCCAAAFVAGRPPRRHADERGARDRRARATDRRRGLRPPGSCRAVAGRVPRSDRGHSRWTHLRRSGRPRAVRATGVELAGLQAWSVAPPGLLVLLVLRLPTRVAKPVQRVATSFAAGICWPREFGRGLGIVLASMAIKVIAVSHFMWAGFAMGAELLSGFTCCGTSQT